MMMRTSPYPSRIVTRTAISPSLPGDRSILSPPSPTAPVAEASSKPTSHNPHLSTEAAMSALAPLLAATSLPQPRSVSDSALARAQSAHTSLAPVRSIRLDTLSSTKQRLKQLDSIALVREQREQGKQELGYHARPFTLYAFPCAALCGAVGPSPTERRVLFRNRCPSRFRPALRPGSHHPLLRQNLIEFLNCLDLGSHYAS